MEGSGYIKLYRKFLEWEWYDNDNCTRLFLHCLLKANYRDKQWRGKTISRGQFFTSIETLSKELHLTSQQIRTSLSKLETTKEIVKKTTNEGTYITICNYDNYQQQEQAEQQTDNKRITNEQQTDNKRITTTNNNKNIKKEKKEYIPAFELWLQYKKERRETYKSDLSTQEAYKHLMTLAGGSPDVAMLIVKQSMANNWAGLFELKKQNKSNDAGPVVNAAAYKPLPKYQ